MADDFTQLNKGVNGDIMDETGNDFPTSPTRRKKPRVVVTGEGREEIVAAPKDTMVGDEYCLAVRPIQEYPGIQVTAFNQATLIPVGVETTITSFVVPTNRKFFVTGFAVSADLTGLFKLYSDGVAIMAARTSVAEPTYTIHWPIAPFWVPEGKTVEVKLTHYATGLSGNAEGTIFGYHRPE